MFIDVQSQLGICLGTAGAQYHTVLSYNFPPTFRLPIEIATRAREGTLNRRSQKGRKKEEHHGKIAYPKKGSNKSEETEQRVEQTIQKRAEKVRSNAHMISLPRRKPSHVRLTTKRISPSSFLLSIYNGFAESCWCATYQYAHDTCTRIHTNSQFRHLNVTHCRTLRMFGFNLRTSKAG